MYSAGDFTRALALCLAVGTWLVLLNQGIEIQTGRLSATLYIRVVLDYATPFGVSSFTGILRNYSDRKKNQTK
ncbi:MAG: hypothetical protein HY297_05335 [Thaumarchaeota archaeon]|nr:hypothetical protein [Nitrososphaerota archaeon]